MVFVLVSGMALHAQQPDQGRKPVARGARAMASASHPIVTQTMLDVLRRGGNAVDAMIAAAILQPVLEPQMSTLAGGLSMLFYEAGTGRLHYLDAELDHTSKDAPIGVTVGAGLTETSGRRIGVPGTVAGLQAAAQRFGTLKWAEYFDPAIRLAERGFPMYSFLYGEMADAALGRISAHPSGREEYLPDGYVPPVGATVTRPRLAATLRRLAADGPDYFYKGEWARRFVDAVQASGGALSMDDLAAYEVRWEDPVRTTYRGVEVASSPPPATAGTLIAMVLNILEPVDLAGQPHYADSLQTMMLVREAFSLAETDSEAYVRDPLSFQVPLTTLLSKEYARLRSALARGSGPLASGVSEAAAMRQTGDHDWITAGPAGASRPDPHYSDTNHLVVVDAQGNWATITHTVYGSTFATGLVVDGIGVNSGNAFPGTSAGKGRRVVSPFPPTMVLKEGKPWVALGSPGLSSRAVTLVLVNLLGFGMDLEKAIDAPRFQGSMPGQTFVVESRVREEVRKGLASAGVRVQPTAPYNWHFGSIHAVMRDPSGALLGYADPRRGGHAEGY
jgi:gamma-glutamyltranspeptidase/glutathione hydrolase